MQLSVLQILSNLHQSILKKPSPSFPSPLNIKPQSPQGLLLCEHECRICVHVCSFCSTAVLFTLDPVSVSQKKAHSYSAVALLRAGFRLGKGNPLLLSVPNVFGSMRLVPEVTCPCCGCSLCSRVSQHDNVVTLGGMRPWLHKAFLQELYMSVCQPALLPTVGQLLFFLFFFSDFSGFIS